MKVNLSDVDNSHIETICTAGYVVKVMNTMDSEINKEHVGLWIPPHLSHGDTCWHGSYWHAICVYVVRSALFTYLSSTPAVLARTPAVVAVNDVFVVSDGTDWQASSRGYKFSSSHNHSLRTYHNVVPTTSSHAISMYDLVEDRLRVPQSQWSSGIKSAVVELIDR